MVRTNFTIGAWGDSACLPLPQPPRDTWLRRTFGQFWVMRDGSEGNSGSPCNGESVSYSFDYPINYSNPSLSAIFIF
jgi:hypothetical protein